MTRRWLPIVFGLSVSFGALAQPALTPDDIKRLSPARIEAALPNEHPSAYYLFAARLFVEGKKDEAVFWFYVGQLRYRVYLTANPALDPSGDPALFASLNATEGQTINEYAGGDVKMWTSKMTDALRWDAQHPNGFTSKEKFKTEYDSVRVGLERLRDEIASNPDRIREQRRQHGLENWN